MDHLVPVGVIEGVGDLRHQIGHRMKGGASFGRHLSQRLPLNVVDDDVRHVAFVGDFVDLDDRGMDKLGGAAGLAQEACVILRPDECTGARHLHGHRAIQLRIPSLVDRSKGPAAQQL